MQKSTQYFLLIIILLTTACAVLSFSLIKQNNIKRTYVDSLQFKEGVREQRNHFLVQAYLKDNDYLFFSNSGAVRGIDSPPVELYFVNPYEESVFHIAVERDPEGPGEDSLVYMHATTLKVRANETLDIIIKPYAKTDLPMGVWNNTLRVSRELEYGEREDFLVLSFQTPTRPAGELN